MFTNKTSFIFCCLFLVFFQLKAGGYQEIQQISIRFENQSLESALFQLKSQIEKTNEYQFVFQDKITNKTDKINQNFEDKTLAQILDVLLKNSDYSYVIINNRWVVVYDKSKDSSKTNQKHESIPLSMKGKVVDENGQPIQAASLSLKKESITIMLLTEENCTHTDNDGSFVISTTDPNAYVIVLYIGYLPRVVHIQKAGLIKLEPNVEILNKVFRF